MSLPFALDEYKSRVERVRGLMAELGLDCLLVSRAENIYYLTGNRASLIGSNVARFHALVLPIADEPKIICRMLERDAVMTQWTRDPRLYLDHEDPYLVLKEVLDGYGLSSSRIGVEKRHLSAEGYEAIRQRLGGAQLLDASGLVDRLRLTLSKAEVECLRQAARITRAGFEKGIEEAKPGAYLYEVMGEIEGAMYKAGQSDYWAPRVYLWAGPKGGRLHDTSLTHRLSIGDLMTIEIHGVHNLYRSAAQGTLYIGESPPASISEAYKLVSSMLSSLREAVKPGITAGGLFDVGNKVYVEKTGREYFRRLGGSLGLTLFDLDLVKGSREEVKENSALLLQALVIEPALITAASAVLVRDGGPEELNPPLAELLCKR